MNDQPPPLPSALSIPGDSELSAAFDVWLIACQNIINAHYATTILQPSILRFRVGPRFINVTSHQQHGGVVSEGGSAYAFIDQKGGLIGGSEHKRGDILKPASYKAPAKHARGNLWDKDKGMKHMGEYGPAYLR